MLQDPIIRIIIAVAILAVIGWIVTKIKGAPNPSQDGQPWDQNL